MEQTVDINVTKSANWIDKRCRALFFSILEKLEYGQLDIIEGTQHYHFPAPLSEQMSFGALIPPQTLHAKMHIHDISAYRDFIKGGSIGAAEAFIDGKWSSQELTAIMRIFASAQQQTDRLEQKTSWFTRLKNSLFHWQNRNSRHGSKRNILAHYDLGNELYKRFLDPEMIYSSAIYPHQASTLAEAQLHKLETICQRLELNQDDHLLEIGTGWGGLAIYAAKNYACQVTTTTISDEQYAYAKKRIKQLGLEDKITLLKEDYRNLTGTYDKLVSVEMIEAVGFEYLPSFFKLCNDRLKPGGKLLIQSITIADQRFEYYRNNVDFIQRYIFPGGFLPSISVLSAQLSNHTSLVIDSINDIGLDYARTLADWRQAFIQAWPELIEHGFDDKFKRLWLYYLAYCEGGFRERVISTVHLVARK